MISIGASRWRFPGTWLAAAAVIAVPGAATDAQQPPAERGGYSIFAGTIGDMTSTEYEAQVRAGAVALWGLGVIEEHGPHLPLATDSYGSYVTTTLVREELAQRGIPSVVIPVFYWGVTRTMGSFPGSFNIRPEVMIELMVDVARNLKRDGIQYLFCTSSHGDSAHVRAIFDGVRRGTEATGLKAYLVIDRGTADRVGLDLTGPHLIIQPNVRRALPTTSPSGKASPDVHAGAGETSGMLGNFPAVVRTAIIPTLPPTDLTQEDLAEWRLGYEHARRVTPRGYFGDPAGADAERGRASSRADARSVAGAIASALRRPPSD